MTKLVSFLIDRLKEKSTITTIVTLIGGAVGLQMAPEQKDTIIAVVVGIVSLIPCCTRARIPSYPGFTVMLDMLGQSTPRVPMSSMSSCPACTCCISSRASS